LRQTKQGRRSTHLNPFQDRLVVCRNPQQLAAPVTRYNIVLISGVVAVLLLLLGSALDPHRASLFRLLWSSFL
jgi:hypothetical protein